MVTWSTNCSRIRSSRRRGQATAISAFMPGLSPLFPPNMISLLLIILIWPKPYKNPFFVLAL
jgi:hypothetical protein